ncbi:MAG: nuclear transport factor 2 family protein [Methylobacteriaceae bacterium]|nr:nuclear transport factor 2 family protein [Methylobacteriaceae bacterium]MBV9221568.1 nuclear transport factor 2 family protein [Methylobacteriaceae bacterium]MBV9243597.1 nuclear transport factor 2 family protein [Methylobacteriaceae bacterium]MBV9633877.1 nuclear transport factor 2 family protein [Methylobacteriaceae bacterium]MBV9704468.1 nuclear transport factor 2 family protein [Methylobacteriaceae bacterium]
MTDPIDIARRCFQAYIDNDRAAIEALVAENFTFTSPLDNRIDRATYFKRCWPNHRYITGFQYRRLVVDGDSVIATYEGRGDGGRGFRNTEILTVRDGKIVEVEVYFGWSLPHPATPGGFVDS